MRLSDIQKKRVSLAIDFMDEVLNVTYDPSFLTPEREQEIDSATDSEQMSKLIAGLVTSWDLVDDEGTAIPLNEDDLLTIPTIILATVLNKVSEDIPNQVRAEGKASRATSRRAE
jgi:hypothetical protein